MWGEKKCVITILKILHNRLAPSWHSLLQWYIWERNCFLLCTEATLLFVFNIWHCSLFILGLVHIRDYGGDSIILITPVRSVTGKNSGLWQSPRGAIWLKLSHFNLARSWLSLTLCLTMWHCFPQNTQNILSLLNSGKLLHTLQKMKMKHYSQIVQIIVECFGVARPNLINFILRVSKAYFQVF